MAELTLLGLRVVREVAARGSFTAAAASLGYTQSAVSRQVAAMEAAAGAPLFERGARGVRPTESGQALLRHAGEVLDQIEAGQRELLGLRGMAAGRLRLGAFPTAVAALVPRALATFSDAHPDVEIALREGTTPSQLRRLRAGSIDLAIVGALAGRPPEASDLTFEPIMDDPLLLAVGRDHPLAGRRTVSVDALAVERWIAGGTDPRDTFLGAFSSLEWEPRIKYPVREWTAKLGLVAAGLGVTLVPGLAAAAVRDDVALLRVRAKEPPVRRVLLAARAAGEPRPAAVALAGILHQVAAALTVELERRLRG
jgi:DNA-binding transcriptional LysR family regulator